MISVGFFDIFRSKPKIPSQSLQIRYIPHVAMTEEEQAMMWRVVLSLGNACVFIGSRCLAMTIGPEYMPRNVTASDFNFIMNERALEIALKEFRKLFELRGPPPADFQVPQIEEDEWTRRFWRRKWQIAIAPTLPGRPHGAIVLEGGSWKGGPSFVIREALNDGSSLRLITAGVRD